MAKRELKYLDPSFHVDWLFKKTLGRLKYYNTFAPGINIIGDSDRQTISLISDKTTEVLEKSETPSFIDFGARDGVRRNFAHHCDYTGVDISPRDSSIIAGDICGCPHIPDNSYDIVFSFDVFEHVERPWDAALECIRVAKPGGIIICRTLFSYRFHPEPNDFWRFSSSCLEHLFTKDKLAETLVCGYDIRERRRNRKGVFIDHRPPIDWLGGWRENWQVLWIGRKL